MPPPYHLTLTLGRHRKPKKSPKKTSPEILRKRKEKGGRGRGRAGIWVTWCTGANGLILMGSSQQVLSPLEPEGRVLSERVKLRGSFVATCRHQPSARIRKNEDIDYRLQSSLAPRYQNMPTSLRSWPLCRESRALLHVPCSP